MKKTILINEKNTRFFYPRSNLNKNFLRIKPVFSIFTSTTIVKNFYLDLYKPALSKTNKTEMFAVNIKNKDFISTNFLKLNKNNKESNIFLNFSFDKSRLKNFVLWFLKTYGQKKTIALLEQFKEIGFSYATQAGISLGIDDLKIPPLKFDLLLTAQKQTNESILKYKRGEITGMERLQRFMDSWHQTSENLKKEVVRHFESTDLLNPVYMMAFSGARGNLSQVRQLVGMRGLMSDPQGQIIDFPIRSNFREGLTLTEYIISTYGARKGIVDTALRTANAGYLTRRLVDVAQHVIVSEFDCGTSRGIFVFEMKEGNKTIYSLQNRLIGRVLAKNIYFENQKIASRNEEISGVLAVSLSTISKKIFIRSPLTCQTKKFVCQLCYGWNLSTNRLVSIGEAVGVIAAQSIGEPGTQLTMRTFHTGGVFSGGISDQIIAQFDGIVEYNAPITGLCIRTPQGDIAFLTKSSGSLIFQKSETKNGLVFDIPPYTLLFARNGQKMLKKQIIAQLTLSSAMTKQRSDAEQTVYSEYEGEIYNSHMDIIEKTNEFQDLSFESWGWGYFWILAGKIYQFPMESNLFAKPGDLINKNSVLNRISWISPDAAMFQYNNRKIKKNQILNSLNFSLLKPKNSNRFIFSKKQLLSTFRPYTFLTKFQSLKRKNQFSRFFLPYKNRFFQYFSKHFQKTYLLDKQIKNFDKKVDSDFSTRSFQKMLRHTHTQLRKNTNKNNIYPSSNSIYSLLDQTNKDFDQDLFQLYKYPFQHFVNMFPKKRIHQKHQYIRLNSVFVNIKKQKKRNSKKRQVRFLNFTLQKNLKRIFYKKTIQNQLGYDFISLKEKKFQNLSKDIYQFYSIKNKKNKIKHIATILTQNQQFRQKKNSTFFHSKLMQFDQFKNFIFHRNQSIISSIENNRLEPFQFQQKFDPNLLIHSKKRQNGKMKKHSLKKRYLKSGFFQWSNFSDLNMNFSLDFFLNLSNFRSEIEKNQSINQFKINNYKIKNFAHFQNFTIKKQVLCLSINNLFFQNFLYSFNLDFSNINKRIPFQNRFSSSSQTQFMDQMSFVSPLNDHLKNRNLATNTYQWSPKHQLFLTWLPSDFQTAHNGIFLFSRIFFNPYQIKNIDKEKIVGKQFFNSYLNIYSKYLLKFLSADDQIRNDNCGDAQTHKFLKNFLLKILFLKTKKNQYFLSNIYKKNTRLDSQFLKSYSLDPFYKYFDFQNFRKNILFSSLNYLTIKKTIIEKPNLKNNKLFSKQKILKKFILLKLKNNQLYKSKPTLNTRNYKILFFDLTDIVFLKKWIQPFLQTPRIGDFKIKQKEQKDINKSIHHLKKQPSIIHFKNVIKKVNRFGKTYFFKDFDRKFLYINLYTSLKRSFYIKSNKSFLLNQLSTVHFNDNNIAVKFNSHKFKTLIFYSLKGQRFDRFFQKQIKHSIQKHFMKNKGKIKGIAQPFYQNKRNSSNIILKKIKPVSVITPLKLSVSCYDVFWIPQETYFLNTSIGLNIIESKKKLGYFLVNSGTPIFDLINRQGFRKPYQSSLNGLLFYNIKKSFKSEQKNKFVQPNAENFVSTLKMKENCILNSQFQVLNSYCFHKNHSMKKNLKKRISILNNIYKTLKQKVLMFFIKKLQPETKNSHSYLDIYSKYLLNSDSFGFIRSHSYSFVFTDAQMLRCSDAQMLRCSDAQLHSSSDALMPKDPFDLKKDIKYSLINKQVILPKISQNFSNQSSFFSRFFLKKKQTKKSSKIDLKLSSKFNKQESKIKTKSWVSKINNIYKNPDQVFFEKSQSCYLQIQQGWVYISSQTNIFLNAHFINDHECIFYSGKTIIDDVIFENHRVYLESIFLNESIYALCNNGFTEFLTKDEFVNTKKKNESDASNQPTEFSKKKNSDKSSLDSFKVTKIIKNDKSRFWDFKFNKQPKMPFVPKPEEPSKNSETTIALLILPMYHKVVPNLQFYKKKIYSSQKNSIDPYFSILTQKIFHSNLLNKQNADKKLISMYPGLDIKISSNFKTIFLFNKKKHKNILTSGFWTFKKSKKTHSTISALKKVNNSHFYKKNLKKFSFIKKFRIRSKYLKTFINHKIHTLKNRQQSYHLNLKNGSNRINEQMYLSYYPTNFLNLQLQLIHSIHSYYPFNNNYMYFNRYLNISFKDLKILKYSTENLGFSNNHSKLSASKYLPNNKSNRKTLIKPVDYITLINSMSLNFCGPSVNCVLAENMSYLANQRLTANRILRLSLQKNNKKYNNNFFRTYSYSFGSTNTQKLRHSDSQMHNIGLLNLNPHFPLFQNQFLLPNKNRIFSNRSFAFTSFFSPSVGEILPFSTGRQFDKNYQDILILTKSDLFSISINENSYFQKFSSIVNTKNSNFVGSHEYLLKGSVRNDNSVDAQLENCEDDQLRKFINAHDSKLAFKNFLNQSNQAFLNLEAILKKKYEFPVFKPGTIVIQYQKKLYKIKGVRIGFASPYNKLRIGSFLVYGDVIYPGYAMRKAGQIIHMNIHQMTFRNAQAISASSKGLLHAYTGDFVEKNSPVITLPFQTLKTGDIVQGIPKVEQYFEARTSKAGRLFRDSLSNLLQGLFERYRSFLPLNKAVRQSVVKIQQIIIDGIQRVYRSQGVGIVDKHLEVIVRQMTSKVQIINGGQSGFFPGELFDIEFLEYVNTFISTKVKYEPLVLGITRASLEVDSFLSAASFQQTTKILSKAAIMRKKDFLKGLKENLMIGNLIPGGTGYLVYLDDL